MDKRNLFRDIIVGVIIMVIGTIIISFFNFNKTNDSPYVAPKEDTNSQRISPAEDNELNLKLPKSKFEADMRRLELTNKINITMNPLKKDAELHCVMNGQGIAGIADNNCVRLILYDYINNPSNIQKIVKKIDARHDEYDLVKTMLFSFSTYGIVSPY
jgi:hypothetical protein